MILQLPPPPPPEVVGWLNNLLWWSFGWLARHFVGKKKP